MLKHLLPGAYAPDVFSIDYQKLRDRGYKAILFDIDNTLVHHNKDATPEVEALFEKLHAMGLKTVLVSNNDRERVERFLARIESQYICDARKPELSGYRKALALAETAAEEAVFIGDQMFIDILGANRAGIDSIMVHFIVVNPKEKIGIRRHVENVVLFFYNLRRTVHKLEDVIVR